MANTKKVAAFFDFDNTLLAVDSAKLGVKYIWQEKMISTITVLKIFLASRLFKWNLYSADKMARLVITLYKGKEENLFADGAKDFYLKKLKPNLAPNIIDKMEMHRSQGHLLVLLSASLKYILTHVKDDLLFDELLCTELETKNGILTGLPNGEVCSGVQKAISAKELADKLNIDLESSYAYGDHHSDRHILELVGNPVAVVPQPKLKALAKKLNWPIIGFERD